MLSCRDLSHQADAFLDGELSFLQRLRIRMHLSMCNGCSAFMAQMRATRSLVDAEAQIANVDETKIDSILAVFHTKKQSGGYDSPATFVEEQENDKS